VLEQKPVECEQIDTLYARGDSIFSRHKTVKNERRIVCNKTRLHAEIDLYSKGSLRNQSESDSCQIQKFRLITHVHLILLVISFETTETKK